MIATFILTAGRVTAVRGSACSRQPLGDGDLALATAVLEAALCVGVRTNDTLRVLDGREDRGDEA